MPKTGKVEYERRIFAVQGWIVEGVQSSLIIQQVLSQGWCTSIRQAERMLAEARKRWTAHEANSIEERRLLKIVELKHLKRTLKPEYKGTPAGLRSQLQVDKEIIKLEGITPTKSKDDVPDHITEVKITIVRANRNNPTAGQSPAAPATNEG
ncbi:hypothetical protein [Chitinophaga sp. YIM B06452]|uniref:hypothetical protein n=1 Tax=Chitinophaga sp. YIM B06452 TaxID=3082158 RepID=UPI0031FF2BD0